MTQQIQHTRRKKGGTTYTAGTAWVNMTKESFENREPLSLKRKPKNKS